jgi:nicotinate-nucleotide adenylyltransferase
VRVAVFGGSFNPPHIVHALVAAWVRWTAAADRVWFVPVYAHPFEGRQDKRLAPFARRVAWTRALADTLGDWASVSAVEADLPAPSYTVDTLDALARAHPEARFRLVVGADVLGQTAAWKDWGRILAHYDPVVVGREGYPGGGVPPFPAVSSTAIRAQLLAGEACAGLLPAAVRAALDTDDLRAFWGPG